jgi:3-hydroxybutyryl-CoA dehydrogenase
VLVVLGDLPVARELATRAASVGFDVRVDAGLQPWLTLACGPGGEDVVGPRARLLVDGSLHALDPEAAGFHVLAPLGRLIEVTETSLSDPQAVARLHEFAAAIGMATETVKDAAGLVLGRIVGQLINEAAFLIGAGNATPSDVDAGLELGVNHPRGPVTWSELVSLRHVIGVLDALHRETGEPRYRVAPLLRRLLVTGESLSTVVS